MTWIIIFISGYLLGGFSALLLIGLTLAGQRANAEEQRIATEARSQTQQP